MRFDPRRLLKWPQGPRKWTRGAYVLIGVLAVVVVLVLTSAIGIAVSEFPPGKPADPWAAEGAIFGIGAFVLAVLATGIATLAYINSTEKPALRIVEVDYPGRDKPVQLRLVRTGPLVHYSELDWAFRIRLRNDGPVAARFVAIQITFGEGVGVYTPSGLQPWRGQSQRAVEHEQLWWEGGADTVVHPSWVYDVPPPGPASLYVTDPQPHKHFRFHVEVVADDVPPFSRTYTIKMERD